MAAKSRADERRKREERSAILIFLRRDVGTSFSLFLSRVINAPLTIYQTIAIFIINYLRDTLELWLLIKRESS